MWAGFSRSAAWGFSYLLASFCARARPRVFSGHAYITGFNRRQHRRPQSLGMSARSTNCSSADEHHPVYCLVSRSLSESSSLVGNAVAVSLVGLFFEPMFPILMDHSTIILPRWLLMACVGYIAGGRPLAGRLRRTAALIHC